PVDMARDKMPAEPVGQGQGLLEVDVGRRVETRGQVEALSRDLDIEAVVGQPDDRHAGALDGDRVTDPDVGQVQRAGVDPQPQAAAAGDRVDLVDPPDGG